MTIYCTLGYSYGQNAWLGVALTHRIDEGTQTGRKLTNTGLRLRDSANSTAINVKKAGIVNICYKLVLTVQKPGRFN